MICEYCDKSVAGQMRFHYGGMAFCQSCVHDWRARLGVKEEGQEISDKEFALLLDDVRRVTDSSVERVTAARAVSLSSVPCGSTVH